MLLFRLGSYVHAALARKLTAESLEPKCKVKCQHRNNLQKLTAEVLIDAPEMTERK